VAGQRSSECDPAEAALAAALRATGVALRGKYCAAPEENLIDAVTADLWSAAKADLEGGKGTELRGKFRAAHSSSALVVNTFVPMQGGVAVPGVGFIAVPRASSRSARAARVASS
jgi:hypothetical protein